MMNRPRESTITTEMNMEEMKEMIKRHLGLETLDMKIEFKRGYVGGDVKNTGIEITYKAMV